MRWTRPIDQLVQDLRFAARQMVGNPAFTLTAILILALAIGGITAIFSVVDAVLLEGLPYPEPERVVWIWETTPQGAHFSVSLQNSSDWRRESSSFSALAAIEDRSPALTGDGEPRRLQGAAVTPAFFDVLGVAPELGAPFPADTAERAGSPPESAAALDADRAILSHDLWVSRFAANPRVVGSTVILDGRPTVISGVMPAGFSFPAGAEIWTPLAASPSRGRDDKDYGVIARLGSGVSLEQASAELGAVARRLGELHPKADGGWGVELAPLARALVGPDTRRVLFVLLGAVGLLLLLACANVSGLLVARATARAGEMGIRSALGAGRRRLVRQLLVESFALAALGSAAGLALAEWLVALARGLDAAGIPHLGRTALDGRALAFTAAVGLGATLLFGLLPALQASRVDLATSLRASGRGAVGGARRLRSGLVVGEIALALVLLVGAGLMGHSLVRLLGVAPGYDPADVLAVRLDLSAQRFSWENRPAFVHGLVERLEALPGVASAGGTVVEPFTGFHTVNRIAVPGRTAPDEYLQAQWRSVTPGYFQAMDVPLLRGRYLDDRDRGDSQKVTVITASLAERLWPGQNPVGHEVLFGGPDGSPRTVVGEVGDVLDVSLDGGSQDTMFLAYDQLPWGAITLVIEAKPQMGGGSGLRTEAGRPDPMALASSVRQAIRAADPDLPIPAPHVLESNLGRAVAGPRLGSLLLAAFAALALLLAASGVYGLVAYTVGSRTREIGVRLALGARPQDVTRMVLGEGAALIATGLALGLAAAWTFARLLRGVLFETPPGDPATYAGVALVLAAAALTATYLPARRAARVEPAEVVRGE